MAPYARLLAIDGLVDEATLNAMETKNKEELEKLDARLKEAEETEGETEISDALRARASYLTRIGDKVGAQFTIYDVVLILDVRTVRSRPKNSRWKRPQV